MGRTAAGQEWIPRAEGVLRAGDHGKNAPGRGGEERNHPRETHLPCRTVPAVWHHGERKAGRPPDETDEPGSAGTP